jgi:putative colanic acid biosynthesis acetyltransferase WcaF
MITTPTHGEAPYLGQNRRTPYPLGEVLIRYAWAIVQATVFRWSPRCLHRWRVLLLSLFGAEIKAPSTVRIYPSVTIVHPWKLRLASRTMIGPKVTIYNLAKVTIGRGANVSQNVYVCAGTHNYNQWEMPLLARPIVIGENVWIAAEAFIGPGVTIGDLCVIGARSVVMKDMPPHTVCAGNPCRPIKHRITPSTI